jgi:hypothetical protein
MRKVFTVLAIAGLALIAAGSAGAAPRLVIGEQITSTT